MSREIIIDHKDISNPQTITETVVNKFKENNLDVHINEVEVLEDDHDKGVRRLSIKNTKYFTIPDIPWHKKQPMGF